MARPFVWHELVTPDIAGALAFYGSVVGWRADPFPGGQDYMILSASGSGCGGAMQLTDDMKAAGAPARWQVYIGVEDVDAEAAAIAKAGGMVHFGPDDIPGVGRFAAVADPQGAGYLILTPFPRDDAPTPPQPGMPGVASWEELHTTDAAAALGFYGRYGWGEHRQIDMGGMGIYHIFGGVDDDVDIGGVMASPLPPQWLPYFAVASIDAAEAAIHAGGGRIMHGPAEVPGGSFIIQGTDPQGVIFAIVGAR